MVLVCQFLYHGSRSGSLVVMEDDQPLHHCPDHPEVFLGRLLLLTVYHGGGGLVGLAVVCLQHLGQQYVVKGLEQFDGLLEPAVDGAQRVRVVLQLALRVMVLQQLPRGRAVRAPRALELPVHPFLCEIRSSGKFRK